MIPRRKFGATGLETSALGFGAGHIGGAEQDPHEVERLLETAFELGITLFDTAPGYGASEERLGRFLRGKRDAVQLSTKGGYGVPGVPDWTGEVIHRGVDQALARLGVEQLDVFHLHSCPIETLEREDVLRALEDVRRAGKVWVAAYSGENEALSRAIELEVFGSIQCSVNVCDQRALEVQLPRAAKRALGVIAKRPLANAPWRFAHEPHGDYAHPYWQRMRQMGLELGPDEALDTFLRFSAFAPGVHVAIAGTGSVEHLRALARAIERGPLPQETVSALREKFTANDSGWIGQI